MGNTAISRKTFVTLFIILTKHLPNIWFKISALDLSTFGARHNDDIPIGQNIGICGKRGADDTADAVAGRGIALLFGNGDSKARLVLLASFEYIDHHGGKNITLSLPVRTAKNIIFLDTADHGYSPLKDFKTLSK